MQSYINQETRQVKALLKTYLGLLNSAGQQKPVLIKSLIFCVLSAAFLGVGLILIYPFLQALEQDNKDLIITNLLIVLAFLLCSFICRYLSERYDGNGYSTLAVTELREKLGDKLRSISLEYLSQQRSGEINSILMQSVNEAAMYAFMIMSIIISAIILPISAAITLFFIDWRFAIVMLLVFPLAIPLYLWRRKAFRRGFSILAEANGKLKGEAIEYIQGMDVLKATGQTQKKLSQFMLVAKDVADIQAIGTKKGEKPNLIITSIIQLGLFIIIVLGAFLVSQGLTSLWLLAAVILIVARSSDHLNFFVQMSSTLEIFIIGYEKLQELMKAPSLPEKVSETMPLDYGITFENVVFSYLNQDKPVLQNISLTIPTNSLTALVGSSGCGKTTITKLILRFADVSAGQIKIGGIDIREMSQHQLMRMISVVFQDIYLFQDTILNNIRMSRAEASDEEVIAAAKKAQCHEFISQLPDGYNTQLANIGNSLSGGERQRIAIARAILKDAPILILDEPTAALDTQNELAVQKAINNLVKGKTVLAIAHRLSTIVGANQIYVISNGVVAERGDHHQLLAQKGLYYEYWQIQQQVNQF